jgi:hypothetical protein
MKIEELDPNIKEFLKKIGQKGGNKTAERGSQYFRDIRKKRKNYKRKEA